MKNSTGRNIGRLTTACGITLLALAVSVRTGLFRGPITEAAKGRGNNTLVSGSSAPDEATRARITEAFGKLPLSFEANKGQTDESVKFLSRGNGYTLFLTSTEAVLSLSRPEETSDKSSATDRGEHKKKDERARRDVLRMRLLGARSTPRVEGADELSVRSNYFIGDDPKKWRTDLRQYAKVKYTGVYPVISVDSKLARVRWKQRSSPDWASERPHLWKEFVVAGNCRGEMASFRASDGAPQWKLSLKGCIRSIGSSGDMLFAGVQEGTIYAYELSAKP